MLSDDGTRALPCIRRRVPICARSYNRPPKTSPRNLQTTWDGLRSLGHFDRDRDTPHCSMLDSTHRYSRLQSPKEDRQNKQGCPRQTIGLRQLQLSSSLISL